MGSGRTKSGTPTNSVVTDQLFSRRNVVRDKDRDAALVADCLRGDRGAMSSLVGHYEKPVFNVAFRILGNPDDAADVTQTVFLKAFEKLGTFDPNYKFFSWIYRIAINESVSLGKRQRTAEPLAESAHEPQVPEQTLDDETLSRRVQSVLMKLPDDQRSLIVLKHFSELSYTEISSIMEIPEKTVKSRLYSARQKMKKELESRGIRPE